jgi:addiction module HigA family antidote
MPMFNAAHPGRIIREWMGEDITIAALARHLGITRTMLSNIINGKAGVSASMAIKLSQALPSTDARFWITLQANYELSKALREKRKPIAPLRARKAA